MKGLACDIESDKGDDGEEGVGNGRCRCCCGSMLSTFCFLLPLCADNEAAHSTRCTIHKKEGEKKRRVERLWVLCGMSLLCFDWPHCEGKGSRPLELLLARHFVLCLFSCLVAEPSTIAEGLAGWLVGGDRGDRKAVAPSNIEKNDINNNKKKTDQRIGQYGRDKSASRSCFLTFLKTSC